MKTPALNFFLILFVLLGTTQFSYSTSYQWVGNTSTDWATGSNWSPTGIPDSADHITVSSGTYNLVLDQHRKVSNLTLSTKTINLNGHSLTVYGTATMTSGTVTGGNFIARGSLAAFNGTLMDCPVDAVCGYIRLSGSTFNETADFTDTGTATGTGTGGCTFNDDVTITHGGTLTYFTLANTNGDTFNGNVTFTNNSNRELYVATNGSTQFNGNIILNSTSTGGILFGNGTGTSTLTSGKTISIGTSGFSADFLTLKNFTQSGSTAQSLTLTGSAAVNMIGVTFNGNLTVTAPGFLMKNSVFNGTNSFTKTGTGNHQSDGGNTFNGATTIAHTGASGRIRMATIAGDTYNADVTFNSSGQDVQIAYLGNNAISGNMTINSNKVVFNTSTGKVTFTGTNNQTLNGNYNYSFKKLSINKTSGTVTANTTLSVDDSLIFIQGNLITTSTNLLTMKHGSSATGASNSSFVSGPVKKVGNTEFVFPVGGDESYLPLKISAPSTTNSEFIAEYKIPNTSVHSNLRDSTLGHIFRNRYWSLNRTQGTSSVYVTLSWDTHYGIMDSTIKITGWNGSKWKNLGGSTFTGNFINGNLQSDSLTSFYGEFTIGYSNPLLIPTLNCNAVTDQLTLQQCLTGAGPYTVSVTGNFQLVNNLGSGLILPIYIPEQVTLTGYDPVSASAPNWWESACPLLTSDYKAPYNPNVKKDMFLFWMGKDSKIKNLRLRGSNCNFQDMNFDTYLSGGIISEKIGGQIADINVEIENCEISCFSYAGILSEVNTGAMEVKDCYIHHVKGVGKTVGLGYGVWTMGMDILTPYDIVYQNNIYDDCKAAIDGQSFLVDRTISKCSFTQFFISEDINFHNFNQFKGCLDDGDWDYHFCYNNSNNTCSGIGNFFWGIVCNSPVNCSVETIFQAKPTYTTGGWIDFNSGIPDGIPIYDVGGRNTILTSNIFHRNCLVDSKSSNISLNYPNQDVNRSGDANASITITNNTFTISKYRTEELLTNSINNRGGFARIADNYVETCAISSDPKLVVSPNKFEYKQGMQIVGSPQPCEMNLYLKDGAGTDFLNTGTNFSTATGLSFIQFTDLGTGPSYSPLKLIIDEGQYGGTGHTYIIRPNHNKNSVSGTADPHVVSNENYFYEDEIVTDNISTGISIGAYPLPGLYGIDVLAFDATSTPYDFRSSRWNHIPVIVKPTTGTKMLYFNIKDSYYVPLPTLATPVTQVYKQVELNGHPIWRESIAEGGNGWEQVAIDLTGPVLSPGSGSILSKVNLDEAPNSLTFSIVIEDGSSVSYNDLRGVIVWIDNVYIPKAGSESGDNVIADGTIELSDPNEISSTPNEKCSWFQLNIQHNPCDPLSILTGADGEDQSDGYLYYQDGSKLTTAAGVNTASSISTYERRSGQQALSLLLPAIHPTLSCSNYPDNNGSPMISIGTYIDFTDLFNCDDYDPSGSNTLGFNAFPSFPTNDPIPGTNYYLAQNLTIPNGETLTLKGNCIAIAENVSIVVEAGGILNIEVDGTTRTHLFACDGMWLGIDNTGANISGSNGGKIYAYTNTSSSHPNKIEDAICAIRSKGGLTEIRNMIFDHNFASLTIEDAPGHTVSTASRTCGNFYLCSDKILSKNPHIGHLPLVHVQLTNLPFEIDFGKGHNTTQIISNACVGLQLKNSSVEIRNSEFKNIYNRFGLYHPNIRSAGILIENYKIGDSRNIVIDDYLNGSNRMMNRFKNVNMGICVTSKPNDLTLSIKGCVFDNSDFNYIPVSPDFYNTAITVQGYQRKLAASSQRIVNIYDNQITAFRYGIHAINIPNLNIGSDVNDAPYPNKIHFKLGASPTISDHHKGIWLQNCPSARITGGDDNLSPDIENDDEVTSIGMTNFRGIDIENSVGSRINCTTINNIPQSLTFTGQCQFNLLRNNYFYNYESAIELYMALLSAQYQDAGDPLDNHWMDGAADDRVIGTLASLDPIPWYRRSAGTEYDPDPLAISALLQPTTVSPGNIICDDYSTRISRDDLFGAIVADTLYFAENQEVNEYLTRWETLIYMQSDTSILYLSESSDTTYQNFYSQMLAGNTGRFINVAENSQIPDSVLVAIGASEDIIYENDIEFNKLIKNQVYLNKIGLDSILSATDSTTLDAISELNWLQAGDAIYESAGMLGKEIHPSISASRFALTNNDQIQYNFIQNEFLTVTPNPTTQKINIGYTGAVLRRVEIYDSHGALVQIEQNLIEGKVLEINLNPGLYRIVAYDIDGNHYFGKFALIK